MLDSGITIRLIGVKEDAQNHKLKNSLLTKPKDKKFFKI